MNRNPLKAGAFLAISLASSLVVLLSPLAGAAEWFAGDPADFMTGQPQIAQANSGWGGGMQSDRRPDNRQGNGNLRDGFRQGQGQGNQNDNGMMQQLGLTQEQAEKLRAIKEQGRAQSKALHQQLRSKRQALMQYIQSSNANESKAMAMQTELNRLQGEMSALRLKTFFQMRAMMTPEQMQKMQQMKQHRGDHSAMQRDGNFGPRQQQGQMGQGGPRSGGMMGGGFGGPQRMQQNAYDGQDPGF